MSWFKKVQLVSHNLMDAVILIECNECDYSYAYPDLEKVELFGFDVNEVQELCDRLSTITVEDHEEICGQ